MPTYTENVRGGVSTIVCNDCGEQVTNETRHEKEHAARSQGQAQQKEAQP